jgi:hypothetical protein
LPTDNSKKCVAGAVVASSVLTRGVDGASHWS